MNYTVMQHRKAILKQLKSSPSLSYEEIMEAINEYQIASAHNIAVGKFKGIIDYIKEGKSVMIANTGIENIVINSKQQLIDLIKSSDYYNTISNSNFFETCFNE